MLYKKQADRAAFYPFLQEGGKVRGVANADACDKQHKPVEERAHLGGAELFVDRLAGEAA